MLKTAEQIADEVIEKCAWDWPWQHGWKNKPAEGPTSQENFYQKGVDTQKKQQKGINPRQKRLDSIPT